MALGIRSLTSLALIACFAATEVLHRVSAAGRAYPVDSENYITKEFQRINHDLNWDKTNFLIDLSGRYSDCSRLFDYGPIPVTRDTPEGESIVGHVDYTAGSGTDTNSVKEYLRTIIDRWISTGDLHKYIRGANRFGCSVRPGCSGHVVTTCLFSPGRNGITGNTRKASSSTTRTTKHTTPETDTTMESSGSESPLPFGSSQATSSRPTPSPSPSPSPSLSPALAFTPEQYEMTEREAHMTWDRSHLLENLSGFETSCLMIEHCRGWKFTKAKEYGERRGMDIRGRCRFSLNNGSTPDALEKILRAVEHFPSAKRIGCSLIADCRFPPPNGQMYVVVSCLYEI